MTTNTNQLKSQQTESHDQNYLFFQHFRVHPLRTLDIALQDEQMSQNVKILKYRSQFRSAGFRIFRDVAFITIATKFITNIAHHRRSLALSAPKSLRSAFIKYLILPGIITFYLQIDRYRDMMNGIDQLKDKQIEQRYRQVLKTNANMNNKPKI